MMRALALLLLVLPASCVVVTPKQKPFTGCQKSKLFLSQLRREDPENPANSKVIEGDDCGNVKTIIGKWAKSKTAGAIAGSAKGATLQAATAAKQTEDAITYAKELGKKYDAKGDVPESVTMAAEDATTAAKAATEASTALDTKITVFKGKMGDFAKEITDDDMVSLKKETEEAITAADDAKAAAERVVSKAEEAKKKSLESSEGALKVIDGVLEDTGKLSDEAGEAAQKSKHAASDVGDLVTKAEATVTKLDGKIADAGDQAPVWTALQQDLVGRKGAAEDSKKAVESAIDDVKKAATAMDEKSAGLKETKEKAQAAPKELLGKTSEIDATEESARETETALVALKGKVETMMKDSERLEAKNKEAEKKMK
jgi:chromosome segregation ATPase